MRLLRLGADGDIVLDKESIPPVPLYAILSHTWGAEGEEVTFDDLTNGYGKNKIGYEKIRLCANQARRDGLEYFWVDTCCINKANLTELSESIVSMFRWYLEADRCYVYLSDVSSRKRDILGHTNRLWEPSFKMSRWFTRGWTLQELLAPTSVEFFSREWQLLGSKSSLTSLIHDITAIPTDALRGAQPLLAFPVQERMRWAAARNTTRPEDKSYCLQGIFDVVIAPIYGEGDSNAVHRLKRAVDEKYGEQENIAESSSTPWRTLTARSIVPGSAVSGCLGTSPGEYVEELLNFLGFEQMDSRRATIKSAYSTTCAWLLKTQVYMDWIDPEKYGEHNGLLWIKGKPGAGKSTLVKFAHAQAEKPPRNREILASYFFNARGDLLERSTLGLYRSLLFQILRKIDDIQHLFDDLPINMLRSPRFAWTIERLRELLTSVVHEIGARRLKLTCFIDALDECDELEVGDMVQHFEDLGQVSNGSFYVCFASRHYPTIDIRHGVKLMLENENGHSEDLIKYVRSHLRIGKGKSLNALRAQVQTKANGVFFWAVLVIDILNKEFLRGKIFAVQKRLNELPAKLGDLFKEILNRDKQDMEDLLLCIQWILFAKKPLELKEFYYALASGLSSATDDITEWDSEQVSDDDMNRYVLSSSKGLAELTKGRPAKVQFIHESVRDFLIKDGGLYDFWPELRADPEALSHHELSKCCQRYLAVDLTGYMPMTEKLPKASSKEGRELRSDLRDRFPFLRYATQNVFYHADIAAKGPQESTFLTDLDFNKWIRITNALEQYEIRRFRTGPSLHYFLVEQNHTQLIRSFHKLALSDPVGIRNEYACPLSVALAKKQWDAVEALIEPWNTSHSQEVMMKLKAQHNSEMTKYSNPYVWALQNGHEHFADIIRRLPFTDSNPRIQDLVRKLSVAVEEGRAGVMAHLASSNCAGAKNLLHVMCERGEPEIVKHLLDAGSDVNACGSADLTRECTPLQAACSATKWHSWLPSQLDIVKILLVAGADVNASQGCHGSVLQVACASDPDSLDVIKLLLASGADVNARGGRQGNALHAACTAIWSKHRQPLQLELVKMLLDAGADVNATGGPYGTALQAAAKCGGYRVVMLVETLLEAGADVNARGGEYDTALQAACVPFQMPWPPLEVVKLLLNAGADVNAQGGEFGNPLTAACAQAVGFRSSLGFLDTVNALLDAGADVHALGEKYNSAIEFASKSNSEKLKKRLQKAGARVPE